MSDTNNVNTNAIQIVFGPDMEVRKKKKPKKKTSDRKKKALAAVKQALQQFDMAMNEATQKGITIPKELGELPQDISQINSIKELEALALDLQNRTREIQRLVAQGGQQQRAQQLFGEFRQVGMPGIIPVMQQPSLPREVEIQPRPIQPIVPEGQRLPGPPAPLPAKPDPSEDETEEELNRIREQILSKLTPEEREAAEKRLREKAAEAAGQPSQPSEPSGPPDMTGPGFETQLGIQVGAQKMDITAPVGFISLLQRTRQYQEDATVAPVELVEGFYEIPEEKYESLEEQRKKLKDEYDQWSGRLTQPQIQSLEVPPLSRLAQEVNNILTLNVRLTAQQALVAQGKKVKEMAGGPVKSSIVEKSGDLSKLPVSQLQEGKDFAGFKAFVRGQERSTKRDLEDVDNITVMKEFDDLTANLNAEKAELDKEYQGLAPNNKVRGFEIYQTARRNIDAAIKALAARKQQLTKKEEPAPAKPAPVDPPEEAEPAPEPTITPPTKKGRPREGKLSPDEATLVEFLKKNKENEYSSADRQALERIIDGNPVLREDRTRLIRQLETGNKLENVAEFLRKTVGISDKLWTRP
jgi:hypothetical protein